MEIERTKNGKTVERKVSRIGTVPMKYIEDELCLHQLVATGKIEGIDYSVHLGITNGQYYVQFKGMKGSISRIAIEATDFVKSALDAAKLSNKF